MALLIRHTLLSFTIIIISFVACYSTLQLEDPLISLHVDDHSPFIDDGGTFNKNQLIKQCTDVFSSNELGGTSPSLEMVNVNDYGAEGNGSTDDTEVYICTIRKSKISDGN